MADVTVVTAIAGAGSFVVAVAALYLNRRSSRAEQAWRPREDTFLRVRKRLKDARADLQGRAADSQRAYRLDDEVPLLVRAGWLPSQPVPLDRVRLVWRGSGTDSGVLAEACQRTARYWPRSKELNDRYHEVIERLEQPGPLSFFDGSSYRLLDVEPDAMTLTFTQGWYFEAMDTTDVLGYEWALHDLRGAGRKGRYRRWLGSPFALDRRCAIPGVNTLTIRRGDPVPTFMLHQRDATKVAHAQGVTHVIPAGEFQPANLSASASAEDLNLWKNMVREYAEEFLGIESAREQAPGRRHNARLDHTTGALNDARRAGEIDIYYLGIGLDPLTWKLEILSVAIFEAEAFDRIFTDVVRENEEGPLVFEDEQNLVGIPFDRVNVEHRAHNRMLAAGQACLRLAWRHRVALRLGQ